MEMVGVLFIYQKGNLVEIPVTSSLKAMRLFSNAVGFSLPITLVAVHTIVDNDVL
jgi:hypothetical protein